MTSLARVAFPWRTLLLAALLSALAALTLERALATHSTPAPPQTIASAIAHDGLESLPLAAQGPISAGIGAESSALRVARSGTGFLAASPGEGLSERFGRGGVELRSGSVALGLRLAAIGTAGSLAPVGEVAPTAGGNRIDYAHAGVSEWYVNGPAGLEQGFTIDRPLALRSASLAIDVGVSGSQRESLSRDGRGILFGAGRSSLRYGALIATDTRGRTLASRLALSGRSILLNVDTRGARYPLRIDPLIQAGNELAPSDPAPTKSEFGFSVAMSADGRTALIGGLVDGEEKGAAWVFTRSGSTWAQQGPKLTGGGEMMEGQFGNSVSLSADGNTALVGGNTDNGNEGAAWVFTRSGSTWAQQGPKLTGAPEHEGPARFGRSVALSADGNTAVIGGPEDHAFAGALWVFTRSGSAWTQQGPKLTVGKEAELGTSVASSADGNTIAGGGDGEDAGHGALWVFTRSGSTWAQQGPALTGGAEEVGEGHLGESSIALSGDGNTLIGGAPGDNKDAGAAWVFTRSGSTWTRQGPKLDGEGEGTPLSGFGFSVALSADGNTALVGAPYDGAKPLTGAAWEFQRLGSTWVRQHKLVFEGKETEEGSFGEGVALSADGDTALIGMPGQDGVGTAVPYADPPPSAVTGAASSLTTTSAAINGSVAAGASNVASFQYGTTTGYGSSTTPQPLAVSAGTNAVAAPLSGLTPSTTYHFRIVAENSAGISVGADQTFTTAPVVPVGPTSPHIERAFQAHAKWREGKRLASLARRRVPTGTLFSVALNEEARITLTFTQSVAGRKVRGRCVAPSRKNRRGHACRRTVTRGSQSFKAHGGLNNIAFQGRFPHAKKLAPGRYTVIFRAVSSAGLHSNSKALTFTILK